MLFASRVWENICPLEQGKKYRLSFVPRELSSVGIHIHDESGGHLYSYGIAGAAVIAGLKYTYEIEGYFDGYLSMRVTAGSIDELTCEEIVEEIVEEEPSEYDFGEMGVNEDEI